MTADLKGRVALVTGGSGGIGRAIVDALAQAGADVAVNYARNVEGAAAACAAANALGVRTLAVATDVADPQQVDAMTAQVLERLGGLDILVNNSGVTRDGLLMRMKDEDWDQVLDVNLKGAFHCIRAVSRTMVRRRWGRIINISSVVGVTGNAGQANYSASKAGLIGLSKSAARELAGRGVTVNVVAPGFIVTEMTAGLSEQAREKVRSEIPLGVLGTPEDVGAVVAFLAGDGARYITGQVLCVDGGLAM